MKEAIALALIEERVRATRPSRPPALSHETAATIVDMIVNAANTLPLTTEVTLRAIDAVGRHRLAFWDALIWAAARENDVMVIYTEDIPGAAEIEGIRYINPFE